ncbi:MAG: hypothetical protein FWE06_03915 [Oscillospiraceae bacterium]|nr:hypothetical protein [Oscillospiraceae bacterium]
MDKRLIDNIARESSTPVMLVAALGFSMSFVFEYLHFVTTGGTTLFFSQLPGVDDFGGLYLVIVTFFLLPQMAVSVNVWRYVLACRRRQGSQVMLQRLQSLRWTMTILFILYMFAAMLAFFGGWYIPGGIALATVFLFFLGHYKFFTAVRESIIYRAVLGRMSQYLPYLYMTFGVAAIVAAVIPFTVTGALSGTSKGMFFLGVGMTMRRFRELWMPANGKTAV